MEEEDESNESLERALSDLEILCAAYPDETSPSATTQPTTFPLTVALQLSPTSSLILELNHGYPTNTGVQVKETQYHPSETGRLDTALRALQHAAQECRAEKVEGLLACAAAALQAWQRPPQAKEQHKQQGTNDGEHKSGGKGKEEETAERVGRLSVHEDAAAAQLTRFDWYTGEPFSVQKSTFQGHVSSIACAEDVPSAMAQLMEGNSKLHRATHNMMAYRLELVETEAIRDNGTTTTPKIRVVSDNDEDGESGAGTRLSALLELRKETHLVVVVSRWFGGIHLGPKRFAYISNVARETLEEFHVKNKNKQDKPPT